MFLSGNAPATVASAVWAAATRTLTSVTNGTTNALGGFNVSIPAASLVDLRPSGVRRRELNVILHTSTTSSGYVGLYDGATNVVGTTVPANSTQEFYTVGNSAQGCALGNNDATLTASYSDCGWDWL